jgi:4-hydroxybenzoate polyprenyltransferase
MMKLRAYATAAHFGPTMIVTSIAFILALVLGPLTTALGIALTVFLGQLIIGWSNDIYDYQDDLKHHRTNKPLVAGTITVAELTRATFIFIPIAIIANLIGPLGLKGGSVYLLGVGCGIAYNFHFKFSLLSPLPYAIACAALPACVFYGLERTPPLWILTTGSLLGVAFHFLNVLKDLSQDRESNIGGLPQRMGKKYSLFTVFFLLILILFTVIVLR